MTDSFLNSLQRKISEKFGDGIISADQIYDFPVFIVNHEHIFDIIKFLKEDSSMNFGFLTTLCGLHYPDQKGHEMGVMYQLHNLEKNIRVRVKTFFSEQHPEIKSLTPIFSCANWMEREAYDFYGIRFSGHPDLRRILNMEEMVAFPMRKEFPLEDQTREDKDDRMFGR